jgi:hypothetical protein
VMLPFNYSQATPFLSHNSGTHLKIILYIYICMYLIVFYSSTFYKFELDTLKHIFSFYLYFLIHSLLVLTMCLGSFSNHFFLMKI